MGTVSSLSAEDKAMVETQFAKHTRFARVYDFNTPTTTSSNVHETRRSVFRNYNGNIIQLADTMARMPHLHTLDLEMPHQILTSFVSTRFHGLRTLRLRSNSDIIMGPLASSVQTLDIECEWASIARLPNIVNLSLKFDDPVSVAAIVAECPHLTSFAFQGENISGPVTWPETLASLSLKV